MGLQRRLGEAVLESDAVRLLRLMGDTGGGGPSVHDPVTLDANADTILSLSNQELGLDTQTANTVWSGPTAGGAAVPTFRALIVDDVTDLAYAVPALTFGVANAEGAADTVMRTDATLAIFDATVPGTIECDDAAGVGAAAFAARRDHQHAIVCAAPGANLSVSTTNAEGAAASFARSDHSHAITSSSNPGAAAAILASDASGYLQLVGLGIGTAATAASSVTMVDDAWIGLGAAAGRVVFNSTPDPDQVTVTAADLYFATTSTGIVHVDGVAAGMFLRADGTRYGPDTLDVDDLTDLAYAVPALTFGVANAEGAADTVMRTDATLAIFDATVPGTIECDDAAGVGAAAFAARRDHQHAIVCAAPGANLSVSTTNAEGAAASFARSDHSHAITSSSNPGAAAAILASDASGYLQLVGLGIGTAATAASSVTMVDDAWIGLGGAAGRVVFNSTPDPDQVTVTAADLYFATTSTGIVHVDGVTDGQFLRADGTRYVPDTLDVDDLTDLAYAVPALTFGVANAEGAADTVMRTDATLAIFDATVPGTIECDDAAAVGAAAFAARRDHQHAIVCAAPGANLTVSTTNTEGSAASFARSDHSHAITSSSNPGAAASILASGAAGRLTLVDLATTDDVIVGDDIISSGDTNTYIDLTGTADQIAIYAGGIKLIDIVEGANDYVQFPTRIGVGVTLTEGTAHIHTATAGAVTASTGADELVVENSTVCGISILAPDASNATLFFGSPSDNTGARVRWNYDDLLMTIGPTTVGGELSLLGGNAGAAVRIDSNRDVGIGITSGLVGQLHVDQSSASGAQPVLFLDQGDISEQCIQFSSNATDQDINLWTVNVTGTPTWFWDESENAYSSNKGVIITAGNVRLDAGLVYVNDSTNGNMARGITVNQGANDDEILALKSSDVAHGMTVISETDTFAFFSKYQDTSGGLLLGGMKDADGAADGALVLAGYLGENASTDKDTTARAIVMIGAYIQDGTDIGDTNADGNLLALMTERGGGPVAVGVWDEDGDYYYDGGLNNYDEYDDALAAWDLSHVLAGAYEQVVEYNQEALMAMGIIHPNPDGETFMVSNKRVTALLMGAVGQLYEKCQRYELAMERAGLLVA